jgi:hypothetical protein
MELTRYPERLHLDGVTACAYFLCRRHKMIYALFLCGSLLHGCQIQTIIPSDQMIGNMSPLEYCESAAKNMNPGKKFTLICAAMKPYSPWHDVMNLMDQDED